MVYLSLLITCLLAPSLMVLGAPASVPFTSKQASLATKAGAASAYGYKKSGMYGYAPGGYGGAYGNGFPFGGAGGAYGPFGGVGPGAYGSQIGPFGLGAAPFYGLSAGFGLGNAFGLGGQLGYSPHMLSPLNAYKGGAGGYGVYPTLGKSYNQLTAQFPSHLGFGGMYGKYAGGPYMNRPSLAFASYGQGLPAGYGGKNVGGYGHVYQGSAFDSKPGYGSVGMLAKRTLTTYG